MTRTPHPTPERTLRRPRGASLIGGAAALHGAAPVDVRLMNGVTLAVIAGTAVLLAAALVLWLTRWPGFELRGIELSGELTRNSAASVRAQALPGLAGNFFSIDLARTQRSFETLPWVRRAVVKRVWPDRLAVKFEEHHAVAIWETLESADGRSGADRLVNSHGEPFEANLGDVEDDGLPTFAGPEGSTKAMLGMWQRLKPAFAERALVIDRLVLSARGSWRAELDNGAVVELGRGSEVEVAERSGRFLRTLAQLTERFGQPLRHADLRHGDGYALRLRGVGTQQVAAGAAKAN
jgi:cell division protein FtsQ